MTEPLTTNISVLGSLLLKSIIMSVFLYFYIPRVLQSLHSSSLASASLSKMKSLILSEYYSSSTWYAGVIGKPLY